MKSMVGVTGFEPATYTSRTDHVHIVPLVPQALEMLKKIPKPHHGDYLLSSTGGRVPIQGVAKYFNTRLPDAIVALSGAKLSKSFTSHDPRRTRQIPQKTPLPDVVGSETRVC
jgi:integrase